MKATDPEADHIRLRHMLDAAQSAAEFAGTSREEFDAARIRQSATVRELTVLGEAAKSVSVTQRERWPDFPWREMMRMRDVLTHHYFGIELDIVWSVVVNELPSVISDIGRMLDELESGGQI